MHEFRIGKPQQHRPGKWRCSISRAGARAWGPLGHSPEQAIKGAQEAIDASASGIITVREAIESYVESRRSAGVRLNSLRTTGQQLRRVLEPAMSRPIASVTPRIAAQLYERIRTLPGERGRVLSVATHRHCLQLARVFFTWCSEHKLASANPFEAVRGVGLSQRGKPQLRLDEARRLVQLALTSATAGHDGALAVLMALVMGMRAGEIVSRTVRDLDDGGALLWIDDVAGWRTKTRAARRSLAVPVILQPLLRQRALGKTATGLLFPAPRAAGLQDPSWVRRNTIGLCKRAGLPLVCAHSLRGLHATIAVKAGATPQVVASALGHESSSMTLAAYALPGSREVGNQQEAEAQLLGGAQLVN